ncbi:YadA-like family protein [Dyella tabacisoli]|uniref:YadA family autotransporter adhesin n=1 Tax=Dyella tabacisoli TaxID=2282381 RepID=UPI003CCCCC2B
MNNVYATGTKYFHANSTGTDSTATGANSVAIGQSAVATNANDVALGSNSATTATTAVSGATIGGTAYTFAGATPTAALSVGGRQIQNVAAGQLSGTSTDAVNGSQLFATNQQVTANSTSITNLNNQVGSIDALNWDPAANSGAGAWNANHKGSGPNKITNVAAGTLSATSTDAVNGSQLNTTNTNVTNNTAAIAGNTTSITNLGNQVNNIYATGTKYFHANSTGADSTATGADSVAIGQSAVATNANDVALGSNSTTTATTVVSGATIGGTAYTFAGATPTAALSVGGRQIQNVAAGQLSGTSTDAVNGSQLFATNQQVTANSTSITNLNNQVGSIDALNWDPAANGGAGAWNANHKGSGPNKITNVAAGTLSATSTDAVNGSQLNTTNTNVTNVTNTVNNIDAKGTKYFHANSTGTDSSPVGVDSVAIGTAATASNANDVALGAGSITAAAVATAGDTINGTSYSYAGSAPTSTVSVGSAGNERTITHVAAGRVSAASTDAVNGSQLFATNSAVNSLGTTVNNINNGAGIKYFHANSSLADASATGTDATASGALAVASATSASAYGKSATASGNSSVAVGDAATASTDDAVAIGHNATANGGKSVSIGSGNTATGDGAVAIGDPNTAIGTGAVAMGANNTANGQGAVALGNTSVATGQGSVALGNASQAKAAGALAFGDSAVASNAGDVALGSGSVTAAVHTGNYAIAGGTAAATAATSVVSIGAAGAERQLQNVASGVLSATSTDGVNGSQLFATNTALTNLGNTVNNINNGAGIKYFHANSTLADSSATGSNSVAVGPQAVSSGANSVAIGNAAAAANGNSVALGANSTTSAGAETAYTGAYKAANSSSSVGEVSVGSAGNARKITNVADGSAPADAVNVSQLQAGVNNAITQANSYTDQQVTNLINTAGPTEFKSNSKGARSLGPDAAGPDSAAGGAGSIASGSNSTAVGNNSTASADNSVAIGQASVADRASTVSVGSVGNERQITNVAAGSQNTDAVNVSQLKASQTGSVRYDTNADGTVNNSSVTLGNGGGPTTIHNVAPGTATSDAVNVGQLNAVKDWSKSYTDQRFNTINSNLNTIGNRANAGVASAMAMSSLPQAYQPNQSAAAVAVGSFHGETGIAIGVSTISESGRWVYKLNATSNTRGDTGVGVGAAMVW